MTEADQKEYFEQVEREFEEWMDEPSTHWTSDEDAAWQAWRGLCEREFKHRKEADELRDELKTMSESETALHHKLMDYAEKLTQARKELEQSITMVDLIKAVETMNRAAVTAISGGMVLVPTSLSDVDGMEILEKAESYLEDCMNLEAADIAQIYFAVIMAIQESRGDI